MDDQQQSDYQSREYPVREDMAYQLKVWRFERWGWYAFVAVVVLTLAGGFSRGPISSREAYSHDRKVTIYYEMLNRNGSTKPMKVVVNSRESSQVEVELVGDFLEGFSIETMQPDPMKSVSSGQGIKLSLHTDSQGQATLYLMLRSDGLGAYNSRISVPGSPPVNLTQYILP